MEVFPHADDDDDGAEEAERFRTSRIEARAATANERHEPFVARAVITMGTSSLARASPEEILTCVI